MKSDSSSVVSGVVLENGEEIEADIVLSNATPKVTFLDLLPKVNLCVCKIIFKLKQNTEYICDVFSWFSLRGFCQTILKRTLHALAMIRLSQKLMVRK